MSLLCTKWVYNDERIEIYNPFEFQLIAKWHLCLFVTERYVSYRSGSHTGQSIFWEPSSPKKVLQEIEIKSYASRFTIFSSSGFNYAFAGNFSITLCNSELFTRLEISDLFTNSSCFNFSWNASLAKLIIISRDKIFSFKG